MSRLLSDREAMPAFSRPRFGRHDLHMALIVTRREIKDSFRDWRIIAPTIILTLFFPFLMNFTADRLLNYVGQFGAELIAERLIPFLLLVVGFFPMSFSLVIALETFVGEKERKSLEPLLATPLTNTQLYLGKIMAALVPPLLASYLGITVYLVGLAVSVGWYPPFELLAQALLLTTIQGVVMVSGAVVISSQTTSVRASNLLASFIIVPMALLIQAEAVALFFANYAGLWWIIAGMAVTALILVRTGVHLFNREELLGRDIDHIRLGWMARVFWRRFVAGAGPTAEPALRRWYRLTLSLLPQLRLPSLALLGAALLAVGVGVLLAQRFPFPASWGAELSTERQLQNLAQLEGILPAFPLFIFLHNLRVIALQVLVGIFTFGVLGILVFMFPWLTIAFLAAQLASLGLSPGLFLATTVLPHGVVEMPALWLISAAALRWHILLVAPPQHTTVSESWLEAGADFFRLFLGLGLPLMLLAAFLEAFLTPAVLAAVYG